jgi:predicted ATP-dependent protease
LIPATNVKDLMLRKDVVDAVKKQKFKIFSVSNIDEGIEILTDMKAGKVKVDGTYPKGTINYLVDEKLKQLAEGLTKFGKDNNNKNGKSKVSKKKGGEKKK